MDEPGGTGARPTTVGVPRESGAGERRVALVPKIVEKLRAKGVEIVVEEGAGLGALISDGHYADAGAKIGDPWSADVVVKVAAMESVPRISRAQTMDALSSQAGVTGYKAVVLAAECSTRFFPMLTTAAGTVKPAQVLVLGVGVAGLQALATAKRLGARTTGYDVRPDVADQVRSLGAQWPNRPEQPHPRHEAL